MKGIVGVLRAFRDIEASDLVSELTEALRREQGDDSLRAMARRTGISPSTLSRLFHGKQPSLDTLIAVIRYLTTRWVIKGPGGYYGLTGLKSLHDSPHRAIRYLGYPRRTRDKLIKRTGDEWRCEPYEPIQ